MTDSNVICSLSLDEVTTVMDLWKPLDEQISWRDELPVRTHEWNLNGFTLTMHGDSQATSLTIDKDGKRLQWWRGELRNTARKQRTTSGSVNWDRGYLQRAINEGALQIVFVYLEEDTLQTGFPKEER